MGETVKKIKHQVGELNNKDVARLKAVAVKYDVDKDKAPKIIATGKGTVAEEILRIAEENNVPMYEDPTLADLLSKLELDKEIPPELYTLIAEVLSFVYQLDKMAKKRAALRKKFVK